MIPLKMCHLGITPFNESHFAARHKCGTIQTFSLQIKNIRRRRSALKAVTERYFSNVTVPKFYKYKDK